MKMPDLRFSGAYYVQKVIVQDASSGKQWETSLQDEKVQAAAWQAILAAAPTHESPLTRRLRGELCQADQGEAVRRIFVGRPKKLTQWRVGDFCQGFAGILREKYEKILNGTECFFSPNGVGLYPKTVPNEVSDEHLFLKDDTQGDHYTRCKAAEADFHTEEEKIAEQIRTDHKLDSTTPIRKLVDLLYGAENTPQDALFKAFNRELLLPGEELTDKLTKIWADIQPAALKIVLDPTEQPSVSLEPAHPDKG